MRVAAHFRNASDWRRSTFLARMPNSSGLYQVSCHLGLMVRRTVRSIPSSAWAEHLMVSNDGASQRKRSHRSLND